jgi:hypothetical protein
MFWRRKRSAADFKEEILAHLELEAGDLRSEGLPEEDARIAARRAFGNMLGVEERFYEMRRLMWFDDLVHDVRYGLRAMRKSPGFTLAVVFTLALGMGANMAIFSLIDALLLRSLPVTDPARLYFLRNAGAREVGDSPPYPCFERWLPQFSFSLAKLPTGKYNCQVTVIDPTAQKASYWQSAVMLVP